VTQTMPASSTRTQSRQLPSMRLAFSHRSRASMLSQCCYGVSVPPHLVSACLASSLSCRPGLSIRPTDFVTRLDSLKTGTAFALITQLAAAQQFLATSEQYDGAIRDLFSPRLLAEPTMIVPFGSKSCFFSITISFRRVQ